MVLIVFAQLGTEMRSVKDVSEVIYSYFSTLNFRIDAGQSVHRLRRCKYPTQKLCAYTHACVLFCNDAVNRVGCRRAEMGERQVLLNKCSWIS